MEEQTAQDVHLPAGEHVRILTMGLKILGEMVALCMLIGRIGADCTTTVTFFRRKCAVPAEAEQNRISLYCFLKTTTESGSTKCIFHMILLRYIKMSTKFGFFSSISIISFVLLLRLLDFYII